MYLDLQVARDREQLFDPGAFFDANQDKLVILDDVHRTPDIFGEVRGAIDRGREIGKNSNRFLLLGSASIDLLKQSGETLAGRIAHTELKPISVSETLESETSKLWLRGGFPQSYLAPSDESSLLWRDEFATGYLEKDLLEFSNRVPIGTLRALWIMLAHSQGSLFNAANLARSLSVHGITASRYVDLLVRLMLVRQLRPLRRNIRKRLVKNPKPYIRDSGVLHSHLGIETMGELNVHPIRGASWEGFVLEQLVSCAPRRVIPSFYRTAEGAEIDLVLQLPRSQETWAIEIKLGTSPKLTRVFYNALEDVKPDRSFVVYDGSKRYRLSKSIEVIGLPEMCEIVSTLR